jgi:hypothetical protein
VKLNLAGTGQIYSANYILENPDPASNTIANINLSSSPNLQITDAGTKQFTTQADVTWEKTNRLSFDGGGSYFAILRNAAGLLGVTGQQARGDVNYRLTSKLTVGAYYSFSYYLYPKGYGTGAINSFGGIYSYAFSRSMQLRLRGGASAVQNRSFQVVPYPPAIAAITGQTTGIIDSYTSLLTSDISAQLIKDFRGGRTGSLAYAHGISPGNGFFLTSQQQAITGYFAGPLWRIYTASMGFGQDELSAVGQALGRYRSEYGTFSLSRKLSRGTAVTIQAEFRHFDIPNLTTARNQVRITSGVEWGNTDSRLWPF